MSTLVNQTSAYVAGGVVPHRMGNAHLSLFPYEPLPTGDGELIVIAGNDGQFRTLAQRAGHPRGARRRALRHRRRAQRAPRRAASAAARAARHPHRRRSGSTSLTAAGIPCGPINDVRGGVELAERLGLDPVVLAGDVPTVRNPIRLSATPPRYDLPPPGLDEHGDEIRAWLAARRRRRPVIDEPSTSSTPPRSASRTVDTISLMGQDLSGRPASARSASASWPTG